MWIEESEDEVVQKFLAVLTGLVVVAIFVPGCVGERPIVSERATVSNMTLFEQREWVSSHLDAAVLASAVPDGWYDIYWKDVFWAVDRPDDRELLTSAWLPNSCGGGESGRVSMVLKNMTFADPVAAAMRVRAHWESSGFAVRDLYDGGHDTEPNFVADFEDGSQLAMQAGEGGMSLSVRSACSMNNTVTNWAAYLDDEGALRAPEPSQLDSPAA